MHAASSSWWKCTDNQYYTEAVIVWEAGSLIEWAYISVFGERITIGLHFAMIKFACVFTKGTLW